MVAERKSPLLICLNPQCFTAPQHANMSKLPREVCDIIIGFVERQLDGQFLPAIERRRRYTLPPIAAVSRIFQERVELVTFRSLRIRTSDLDTFSRILTPTRQHYVRDLYVYICCNYPPYPPTVHNIFPTPEQRAACNDAATTELGRLFKILAGWCFSEPHVNLNFLD